MVNMYDLFCERVARQPRHAVCVDGSGKSACSYEQLKSRIDAAAAALERAGVSPGTAVGLSLKSGIDYIVLAYAVWKCRGTVVPVAVELTADEKREVCEAIRMDGMVASPLHTSSFAAFRNGSDVPLGEDAVYMPMAKTCDHPPGFEDVNAAFIRFTSGTTATSKGVVLSHETVCDRIHAANEGLLIGDADRVVWLLSMSYHFTVSIVAYLTFGATIILCENHFGETIVRNAAQHRATLIYGSPQHYRMMAHDRSGAMLPSLRLAISTATPLTEDTAEAFQRRFGVPLRQAYGIIEVGLPCINLGEEPGPFDSLGSPLPAYELRLGDVPGYEGAKAIAVRGPGIADAYYRPWRTREEFMRDGWFDTGDLGVLDERGQLFIRGRLKEMISVGGMKLFPQEVERVLESHPHIAEARVFAQPHPRLGEVPHAEVVLKGGSADLSVAKIREFCRRHLSAYKVPEDVRFVDAIARTASGKRLRRAGARAAAVGDGSNG